jgi:4-amino-4-deoxy-L-arabinose transferase-like glycosyltransferase
MIADRTIRSATLWTALIVCLFAHTIYLLVDHNYYSADTPSYLIPAQNLLNGNGFASALHHPEVRRTPGFPLLLALFQIPPLKLDHLVLIQHALCILLGVALAAVILRLTNDLVAAFVAALAFSLDFATIRIANLLLTEITATVLIALIAWTIYRALTTRDRFKYAITAGILGGCAVLVRPVAILYFVPLSLCIVYALRRRALRTLTVFVLSFLLLPVLWVVRNRLEIGYPGLSTISSDDILFYRAAGALAIQQPGNYFSNVEKSRGLLMKESCSELEHIYGRDCLQLTDPERASYFTTKGVGIILRSPVSYFGSVLIGLAYTIFGGGAEALSKITNIDPHVAEFVVLILTIPEAGLALLGCWYWYKANRIACSLLVLTVAYFLTISAGAEAYSRFRVPIMPMYAMLIGGGASEALQIFRRSKSSRLVAAKHIAGGS